MIIIAYLPFAILLIYLLPHMEIAIRITYLLMSLSLLIVLHEMGHFFTARWFKTRVEKFYLFFDAPPFNSLFKIKRGDTEYGIGWLPLGGYVKISGMVDESMDKEQMKEPPKPWEFRSKPAWQRLIIMIGGVTVNFLLGILIFCLVKVAWGEPYVSNADLKNGIQMDSVLIREGFRNGDIITQIGNRPLDRLDVGAFVKEVVLNGVTTATVLRAGQTQNIQMPADFGSVLASSEVQKKQLMQPRLPFQVAEVQAGSAAEKAKIQKGDRVVGMNGQPITFFDEFQALANQNKGKAVTLAVLRGTDTLAAPLTLTEAGTIGVRREVLAFLEMKREKTSLAGALPAGWQTATEFLGDQIKAFGQMFKGKIKASENLGGFISIGKLFPSEWGDWETFWRMTASLSIMLAFINLLPIPALDGGYVVFLLWEVVTRRRVSDAFMERAVTFGFFLLLALMVYTNGLDIWRSWFK